MKELLEHIEEKALLGKFIQDPPLQKMGQEAIWW